MTSSVHQWGRALPALFLLALAAGFAALGAWQIERRAWKHDLIAAVERRIHAEPVAAPAPDVPVTAEQDAYRRIRLTGRYLPGETLVRAVSDLGSGYWVMTPLDTGGFVVLVNRGFIPPGQRQTGRPVPAGEITVTGLLRVTESGGGFLRKNGSDVNNWYSRDVAAIAKARALARTASYFVDADASANAPGAPVGGLTVVRFADNHAVYALTWFAMMLMSIGAAWFVAGRPQGAGAHRAGAAA